MRKHIAIFARWLDESNKPDADKELFAAFILYSQAQQNPEKIDLNLIKQPEAELRKGMLMVTSRRISSMYNAARHSPAGR